MKKQKQCTISRFLAVATSRLAVLLLSLLAGWRHLPSGWKWRHWFALCSQYVFLSAFEPTELNFYTRAERNDTHSNAQHFNKISLSLVLLVALLLMMWFFPQKRQINLSTRALILAPLRSNSNHFSHSPFDRATDAKRRTQKKKKKRKTENRKSHADKTQAAKEIKERKFNFKIT